MRTLLTVSIFIITSFCVSVFAQTASISKARMSLVITNDSPTFIYGSTLFTDDTELDANLSVLVTDSIGVDSIHIELDTLNGSTSFYTWDFGFNTNSSFSNGSSFKRNGNRLKINLGKFYGLNNYALRIKLIYINSATSNTYTLIK